MHGYSAGLCLKDAGSNFQHQLRTLLGDVLPSHASGLTHFFAQALQCKQPLLITHRLDACTEGLLVVGRHVAFVQHFNKLLQQPGAVEKFYKALTQYPPPSGETALVFNVERLPASLVFQAPAQDPWPASHRTATLACTAVLTQCTEGDDLQSRVPEGMHLVINLAALAFMLVHVLPIP